MGKFPWEKRGVRFMEKKKKLQLGHEKGGGSLTPAGSETRLLQSIQNTKKSRRRGGKKHRLKNRTGEAREVFKVKKTRGRKRFLHKKKGDGKVGGKQKIISLYTGKNWTVWESKFEPNKQKRKKEGCRGSSSSVGVISTPRLQMPKGVVWDRGENGTFYIRGTGKSKPLVNSPSAEEKRRAGR